MKTRVIIFLLLMLMAFTAIYASEDPAESAAFQSETLDMKALEEKFKAATGFNGVVSYTPRDKVFLGFSGKFQDITLDSTSDSLAIRSAFENIIQVIQPYISAERNQLSQQAIFDDGKNIDTRYDQIVNGHPCEYLGRLSIGFNKSTGEFNLGNGTWNIPNVPVSNPISLEELTRIALVEHQSINKHTITENCINSNYRIVYCPDASGAWRLTQRISIDDTMYYISVEDGNVFKNRTTSEIQDNQFYCVYAYGPHYNPTTDYDNVSVISSPECIPMAKVTIVDSEEETNQYGIAILEASDFVNPFVYLENSKYKLTHSSNQELTLGTNAFTPLANNQYRVLFGDDFIIGTTIHTCYGANVHIEADKHINNLLKYLPFYGTSKLNITTGHIFDSETQLGSYDGDDYIIKLRDGRLDGTIRHELSHNFIHGLTGHHFLSWPDTNPDNHAMDEGLSRYFQAAPTGQTLNVYTDTEYDIADILCIPSSPSLNENAYTNYNYGLCIASALWSLRANDSLGTYNQTSLYRQFDHDLVSILLHNYYFSPYITNPRYLFNLLMYKYATDRVNWTLNDPQKAIKQAYNTRGLKFYPTVESISGGQKGKNIFGLNEPVHVKVSDCPQNTRLNIYVVKHDDYTYTDGATISTLSNYFPIGFTPHTTAITDPNGEWSGLIWNIPASGAVGDYDIIVDIGSPTSPDGVIHYAFSGANVMDGFDGRLQPGFSVLDDGIDVVVATQSSWVDTDVLSRKH